VLIDRNPFADAARPLEPDRPGFLAADRTAAAADWIGWVGFSKGSHITFIFFRLALLRFGVSDRQSTLPSRTRGAYAAGKLGFAMRPLSTNSVVRPTAALSFHPIRLALRSVPNHPRYPRRERGRGGCSFPAEPGFRFRDRV